MSYYTSNDFPVVRVYVKSEYSLPGYVQCFFILPNASFACELSTLIILFFFRNKICFKITLGKRNYKIDNDVASI